MKEMPRYKCHKEVRALLVEGIRKRAGGRIELIFEAGYSNVIKDAEWVKKHNPEAGSYFVQYEDGYQSISPARAFEDGYTKLD